MEVDPTQPVIETPGVKVTIEPEPQTFSPTSQSIQKGQWIVTQVVDFLSQLSENLGNFFGENQSLLINLGLIFGAMGCFPKSTPTR